MVLVASTFVPVAVVTTASSVVGAASPTDPEGGARVEPRVFSSSGCPGLFGTAKQRQRNRTYQKRQLHMVVQRSDGIIVGYAKSSWNRPRLLKAPGIKLQPSTAHGSGVIAINEKVARSVRCRTGLYRLKGDERFGRKGRILKILRGVVLLEYNGLLTFIKDEQTTWPEWLMAWGSRFSIPRPRVTSSYSKSNRRKQRRRHRKRRRR
jgi:hypothetical protein